MKNNRIMARALFCSVALVFTCAAVSNVSWSQWIWQMLPSRPAWLGGQTTVNAVDAVTKKVPFKAAESFWSGLKTSSGKQRALFLASAASIIALYGGYKLLSKGDTAASNRPAADKEEEIVKEKEAVPVPSGKKVDSETLTRLRAAFLKRPFVSSIALSNGNLLAISVKNVVKIIDGDMRLLKQKELPGKFRVRALAFHPKESLLAIGRSGMVSDFDNNIYIYNYETEELLTIPAEYNDAICFSGIAFSPNGKLLVVTSDIGRLFFFVKQDGKWQLERSLDIAQGKNYYALHVSFNTTGKYIAIGSSMSSCVCCHVIDVISKEIVFTKNVPDAKDIAITFHPMIPSLCAISSSVAGHLIFDEVSFETPANRSIEIFDIEKNKTISVIEHTKGASLLAFSHDGTKIASRNDNSDIQIYDIGSKKALFDYVPVIKEMYSSILFDGSGRCITGRNVVVNDDLRLEGKQGFLQIITPSANDSYVSSFEGIL